MFRRIIMATVSNSKGKPVPSEKTKPSTSAMGKQKVQIRSFNSKSSPVYKTQSDTSLVNGMRNLSLRDKNRSPSKPAPNRRGFFSSSGKMTVRNLSDVASLIQEQQAKNIVIVAGAGISTPSGIPDFRTPGTGLYDNLQQYNIPYPEAIFDIDYFHHKPKPFFTLAKELYPSGKYRPNYIHYFVRLLYDKGSLLRMYTQNIDGLERLAGIPPAKLVEAHGTFATATCVICDQKYNGEDIKDKIFEDKIPRCKRTGCPGTVKPDIVFFGEELPKRFFYYLKDMMQTDLVLVMGTSLEVQPFAGIIDNVRWNIPRVLFNRNAVGPFRHNKRTKDVVAEGDLLETMQKFVNMIEWKTDMAELIAKCEGSFKLVTPQPLVEKKENPPCKQNIPQADLWRQNARLDLRRANFEFSSSESLSSTTESESSQESTKRNKSTNGKNGNAQNKVGGVKTDPQSRYFSTGSSQRNSASVNTDIRKPTRGAWLKNGAKQHGSMSLRSTAAKNNLRSPSEVRQGTTVLSREKVVRGKSLLRPSSDTPKVTASGAVKKDEKENKKRPLSDIPQRLGSGSSNGSISKKYPTVEPTGQFHSIQNKPTIRPPARGREVVQHGRYGQAQRGAYRRTGSAELPRLTYRHKMQRPPYDARMLTYGAQSDSSSTSESSSDDDSR